MVITMEGISKFYAISFACLSTTFDDDVKAMYIKWAKTIKVELLSNTYFLLRFLGPFSFFLNQKINKNLSYFFYKSCASYY